MSRLSIRPIIYLHLLIVTLVLSAFFVSAQPGDLSP